MKIAQVTATFPPYTGGTGNVCYHNARELVALGHEVHVFTAQQPQAKAQDYVDGIFVHRLRPVLRFGNAFFLPSLVQQLRTFEIVHIHMPFYGGAEAVLLNKLVGSAKLVVTYHQDVLLSGLTGVISRLHDQTVGRWLMLAADKVCFTSLDYGNESKFGRILRSNKRQPCAVANGVNAEQFFPGNPPSSLGKVYGVGARKVILFVGSLDRAHHFKGIDILVRAMRRIQDDTAQLLVVGKGDMLPEYQQSVDALCLRSRVHFAGFVADDMLVEHYRLADVTVLPSTSMGEAFGLVLLESLASGTPVIASNIPGVRTVVEHGQDGFLVEAGDVGGLAQQLKRFFALDEVERERMGEFGRKKVLQTYQWQHSALQLEQLYRTVLSDNQ